MKIGTEEMVWNPSVNSWSNCPAEAAIRGPQVEWGPKQPTPQVQPPIGKGSTSLHQSR
jgi:hypothetical protein